MRLCVLTLALGASLLTSCSSVHMPSAISEKFTPTYHTHVVQVDARKAYDAAKAALKNIDFRFERGGQAQGRLQAIGTISTAPSLQSSRQLALDLKITPVPDGAEISALFTEITEEDFGRRNQNVSTSIPVKQTGIYDVYFQQIDTVLAAAK